MKKLIMWLRPNCTRTDRIIASIILFLLLCGGIVACGDIDWDAINANDTYDMLITEAVDTFGYTLGCLAAKDPWLETRIEGYYHKVKADGLTMAIINEALNVLIDSDELIYKNLARKVARLAKYFGAKFDTEGNLTEFGLIADRYLVIGKDAYLAAIADSKTLLEGG